MKIKDDFELEVSFDKDEKMVYIAFPTSSGAKYNCSTLEELEEAIKIYINNYIDVEKENLEVEEEMEIEYE